MTKRVVFRDTDVEPAWYYAWQAGYQKKFLSVPEHYTADERQAFEQGSLERRNDDLMEGIF